MNQVAAAWPQAAEATEATDEASARWADSRQNEQKSSKEHAPEYNFEDMKVYRQKMPARDEFMGKAHRNFVTGEICLRKVEPTTDFRIIDLYRRAKVSGSPEQLAEDPYLFKPVIMPMRTWIYHDLHRSKKLMMGTDENGMVKYVMNLPCIDANVSTGHWSPLVCYMPGVLFCALTKDQNTVGSSLLVAVTMSVVGNMCNYASQYRMARYYTMPIRLLHFVIVCLAFASHTEDFVATVGYILCFGSILFDVVSGDLAKASSFRFWCKYNTLRELPNRVFICRREGASHLEELQGLSRPIDAIVHGMGIWQRRRWMLACEICGVICKLEPITAPEWRTMWEHCVRNGTTCTYLGMDLFDQTTPEMYPYDEKTEEANRRQHKNMLSGSLGEPIDDDIAALNLEGFMDMAEEQGEEEEHEERNIAWEVGPDGQMRRKGQKQQEENKDPLDVDVEEFF